MPSQSPRSNKSRPTRKRTGQNKQQQRAAAVRAAQTHEDVFAASPTDVDEILDEDVEPQTTSTPDRPRSGVRVSANRGKSRSTRKAETVRKLTREQEFSFIKADLRRLLLTAGSLAVVMVVLLFVIEL